MAKLPPQPDPDHLFNILKVNKWFAFSSLLLLAGMLGMIKFDVDREWKGWQRKFRKMEISKTAELSQAARAELMQNPEFLAANEALKRATERHKKNEIELYHLEKERTKKEGEKYAINLIYQTQKADLDALRYQLEEAQAHHPKQLTAARAKFNRKTREVTDSKSKLDKITAELETVRGRIATYGSEKKDAETKVNTLQAKLTRLEKKEATIEHSFVNDVFRDLPLLDFINPSLRVNEILVKDLYTDYNFTKVARGDLCVTCHVAIDTEGYENEANPLKTHPKRDLFLASTSKHPIDTFGCTSCHLGMSGGLTFSHAAHTPRNPEQQREWEKKYHWHQSVHWTEPMFALAHTEASCNSCHARDIEVPKGTSINRGIALVERAGCYGCHKIEGWEDVPKAGPSLKRISAKVSREWMLKWIAQPRSFRPTTAMPQFFDEAKRSASEIDAISTYLESKSEAYTPSYTSLANGNSERGKELFGKVGCLGCHTMDDFPGEKPKVVAPELNQVGSKLSPTWLAGWLKNPRDYWPQTRMPSLRLSDDEIRDLVAYLMTKKNETFEKAPKPSSDPSTISTIALDHLKKRMTPEEAQQKLRTMSHQEQLLFVGEKSIAHYGCFGCHEIAGFEDAKPIGTELTTEASKPLSQFDFGFVKIENTVTSWLYQKLRDPRIFDLQKVKEPLEKLKMPNFHFTPEEAADVLTFVLSLRKNSTPEHRKPLTNAYTEAARIGRRILHTKNCRGCHTMEDMGGNILVHYEDPSQGPPNLQGEGQKVVPAWIFGYLKSPTTKIRPWLDVRMPTFEFTDEEANKVIKYFRGVDRQPLDIESPPQLSTASPESKKFGAEVFAGLRCMQCHVTGNISAGADTSNMAPSFSLTKDRLRYDWFDDWLRDPQKLLPGTRMPGFFYSDGQMLYPDAEQRISAVRDYIYSLK